MKRFERVFIERVDDLFQLRTDNLPNGSEDDRFRHDVLRLSLGEEDAESLYRSLGEALNREPHHR